MVNDRSSNDFLIGGGEMGERMRAMDWSQTPLGPADQWPRSLKTIVRIMLTSRQAMWLGWGPELIYLYNDAYKSIIGGKHPDALGQPTSQVWGEIWSEIGPRIERVMQDNEGTYDEALLLIMERYGYPEETYYTFSYSPVPDDDGSIRGLICANTPETERVLRERQLALLQRLAVDAGEARTRTEACALSARSLATNTHDFPFAGIYLLDSSSNELVLAGSAGIEPGHPALPASCRLDDAEALWPFQEAIATSRPVVVPQIDARAGTLPHGAWPVSPHHGVAVPIAASGREGSAGVLVAGLNPYRLFDDAYRDSVELVASQIAAGIANAQAYEDEARRAAALAELDRAKTAFFSNVSHEFRTPLTLMLGPMEDALSEREGALTGEDLDTAYRNALRLLKLVNTLLDFSRIEAGRATARFEETDIAALTRDLASAFRSAIEKAGLHFRVDMEPIDQPVYVDRDMWEKIVLNLLSNALKFTLEGEIEVRVRQAGDAIELTVCDTGGGIPASDLPHVFERFHRVEGTKRRTDEGTGIGLALVQELARLHGGNVAVTSEEEKGTTFTVTIPLGFAHLPAERVGPSRRSTQLRPELYVEEALQWLPGNEGEDASAPAVERRGGARPQIVLADDNPDMREYISRLLAPTYDVIAVTDGAEALKTIRRATPDLVVSDVMMPNLDGFGLLEALRADVATASLPVMLLSARAGEDARIEGFAAGADDYLVKPFAARELLARVAGLIGLVRLRREADESMRQIFMKAPAFICTLQGPEHVVQVANPMYMRLIGEHREVIGKPIRRALPEIEGQGFFELLDRVFATGGSYVGNEMRVVLDQGDGPQERFVDFVYQALRDTSGRVSGIFVHGVDVTVQVRARQELERVNAMLVEQQHALRESEERYRELADLSPLTIWMADASGSNTYVNRWWTMYSGMSREEAAGDGFRQSIHPDDRERVAGSWAAAVERGDSFEQEALFRRADGAYRWHLLRGGARKDAAGRVVNWIGVAVDVHDIREAHEALRAADRMKDEFLATLSHELRTPLTAILGWAQLLTTPGLVGPDQMSAGLETISRAARSQSQLIEDVLDVSRITTGKMRLERRPSELADIINAAVETVRPAADAKEITIRLSLDRGIGPVFLDPDRLQQVIWNLLANAIKFSPPRTTIDVLLDRDERDVRIEVRDEGPGIARDLLPQMFQRFRQADSSSRRAHSGLGLGLALVKDLVELHGGRVEADSDEGKGARFVISLPAPPAQPETVAAPPPPGRDQPLSGVKVLFVDDRADARMMFQMMLAGRGATVMIAASVEEAQAVLAASRPDVVLTDIAMPQRDGYDFLHSIRATPETRTLPVIALTAQARDGDEAHARDAGFEAYLRKPIDADQLVREILRHVK